MGTIEPLGREFRAPFRLYLVTLALRAEDGTGYSATRVERAQDPDGAAGAAYLTELERQAGVARAGGLPHAVDSVMRVRRLVAPGD